MFVMQTVVSYNSPQCLKSLAAYQGEEIDGDPERHSSTSKKSTHRLTVAQKAYEVSESPKIIVLVTYRLRGQTSYSKSWQSHFFAMPKAV